MLIKSSQLHRILTSGNIFFMSPQTYLSCHLHKARPCPRSKLPIGLLFFLLFLLLLFPFLLLLLPLPSLFSDTSTNLKNPYQILAIFHVFAPRGIICWGLAIKNATLDFCWSGFNRIGKMQLSSFNAATKKINCVRQSQKCYQICLKVLLRNLNSTAEKISITITWVLL